MLMIYPIAALFFASGKLLGAIWIGAGESIGTGNAGRTLIGTAAIFAPYYAGPKLLSLAGGALKSIASGVNNAKEKASQTEAFQRTKAKAKSASWKGAQSGLGKTFGRFGDYDGDSKVRKGMSKTLGRVGKSKTVDRMTARASEKVRKMEDEDADAARVLQEQDLAKVSEGAAEQAKAEWLNNEGLKPSDVDSLSADKADDLRKAMVTAGDQAEIDHLASVIAPGSGASSERQRAAAGKLLSVYGSKGDAVTAYRQFQERLATGNASERELFTQLVNDNKGYASEVPQVYKPNSKKTLQEKDIREFSDLKLGSVSDFAKDTEAGGAAEYMIERAAAAAKDPQTKQFVKPAMVQSIGKTLKMEYAQAQIAGDTKKAAQVKKLHDKLEQEFDVVSLSTVDAGLASSSYDNNDIRDVRKFTKEKGSGELRAPAAPSASGSASTSSSGSGGGGGGSTTTSGTTIGGGSSSTSASGSAPSSEPAPGSSPPPPPPAAPPSASSPPPSPPSGGGGSTSGTTLGDDDSSTGGSGSTSGFGDDDSTS
jgi:hypothetical protein